MRLVIAGLLLAAQVFAQSPPQTPLPSGREAQQEAYRNWRETDPNLERDATTAGATLGARADKAAAEGAKYFAASKAYLESTAAASARNASAIEPLTLVPDKTPSMEAFLSSQSNIVAGSIETIARDPDRGIQQLRQALERERAAIAALTAAEKDLQKTQEAVAQTATGAEELRARTSAAYQKLAANLKQSADLGDQTAAAWAAYYRALSDAARAAGPPVTSSISGNSSTPARAPAESGSSAGGNSAANARTLTTIPLSRYVGAWTFPTIGAHYHGMQPLSVDLVVREDNGHASGTMSARFKLPLGVSGDPLVRFDFEGDFQSGRNQKFTLTTTSGAKGTLELIPGPAFNLLEVNFNTDDKPGTIRQANFLLLKK